MPLSGLPRDEADSGVMFEQVRRIRRSDPQDNGRNMARKKRTAKKKRSETGDGVIPAPESKLWATADKLRGHLEA